MERNTSSFARSSWDSKMATVVGGMKLLFWNVQFGLLMDCQSVQYMWIGQELLIIFIYEIWPGGFYDIWLRNNFVAQRTCEHKERRPDPPTPWKAYMAGRLICPEGRVSSFNKSNPTNQRLHGESGHPELPRQIFFGAIPPGGQTAMWRLPTNHKHGGAPTR